MSIDSSTMGVDLPFSPILRVDRFIFLSGQLGFCEDGQLVTGGIENETKKIFERVENLLKTEECDLSNIVKSTCWLADLEEFGDFNSAYLQCFNGHKPTRSTVQARLAFDARIEIEFLAYK